MEFLADIRNIKMLNLKIYKNIERKLFSKTIIIIHPPVLE